MNTKEKNASYISPRKLFPHPRALARADSERPHAIGVEPRLFRAGRNLYWPALGSTIYPCPLKPKSRLLLPFARRAATPSPAKVGSRKLPCACS